jgi:hypothetical protein
MTPSDEAWLGIWEFISSLGFLMVIIGCIIEGVEHFAHFPRKLTKWKHGIEKFGWYIICIGLSMEFVGEKRAKRIADRENTRLTAEAGEAHKYAAYAIERASASDLARVKVEKQIEEMRRPRIITDEQKRKFIAFLKDAPKASVPISSGATDNETI